MPSVPASISNYFSITHGDEGSVRSDPPHLYGTIEERAYGGLIVAQAAKAFILRYPDLAPHTLNYKYISAANSNVPLQFNIEQFDDGKIAAIRAFQNKKLVGMGHVQYSSNVDHIDPSSFLSPECGPPDSYPPIHEAAMCLSTKDMLSHFPVDARVVQDTNKGDRSAMWLRMKPEFKEELRPSDGLSVVLFHSDCTMFMAALDIYEQANIKVNVISSLHHTVWIHESNLDPLGWYLAIIDCDVLSYGRARQYSRIFNESRKCVMTVIQEGYLQRAHGGKL